MSSCHQRAADRIVGGALRNGGLYIKLGQGLCSFNHLLPPEYIRTLQVLEDKALDRRYREVRWLRPRCLAKGRSGRFLRLTRLADRWTRSFKRTSTEPPRSSSRRLTTNPSLLLA